MSDRRGKKKAYPLTACEALEGRELLTHATLSPTALPNRAAALANLRAARLAHHQAILAARANQAMAKAEALAEGQVTPQVVNSIQTPGQVSIPENHMVFRSPSFPPGASPFGTPAVEPVSYTFRPRQYGPLYTPILPGSDPSTAANSAVVSAAASMSTTAATSTTAGTALGAPTPAGSLAGGVGTSGIANSAIGLVPGQVMPAPFLPGGPMNNLTLSKADVAALKSAVESFASAYTGGKDSAADAAALDSFKTALGDISLGIWSETHVAAQTDVTALQKAVDTFAAAYTSGANLATDKAAWQALHTAVTAFGAALKNPNAPAPAPVPTSTTTVATSIAASSPAPDVVKSLALPPAPGMIGGPGMGMGIGMGLGLF
jgi:hypothetical protein